MVGSVFPMLIAGWRGLRNAGGELPVRHAVECCIVYVGPERVLARYQCVAHQDIR